MTEHGGFKPPEPVWDIIAAQKQKEQQERQIFLDGVIEQGIGMVAAKYGFDKESAREVYFERVLDHVVALLSQKSAREDDEEDITPEETDLEYPMGDPLGLQTSDNRYNKLAEALQENMNSFVKKKEDPFLAEPREVEISYVLEEDDGEWELVFEEDREADDVTYEFIFEEDSSEWGLR